jgi:diacylglycerol kinase (ATP)
MTKPERDRPTFFDEVTSTAKIDPRNYAAKTSPNRIASFSYALAGWLYMLRWQKNTRIMALATIAVGVMGFWLRISNVEWALLVLIITVVWLTEFLNAGIEAAIDVASPDIHPMAKVGKDVASAAVLLGAVAALVIGLLILGPPLLQRLGLA